MGKFLEDVAAFVYTEGKHQLDRYCLVFPGRRAALFFTKYFSNLIDQPTWMPQIRTIREFVYEHSGYKQADQIELLFKMHSVYKNLINRNESFDEFYSLGEVLLNDFNDLDKHLIKIEDLFSNLASLKEIDNKLEYLDDDQISFIQSFWSHFNRDISSDQQVFLNLWQRLRDLYVEFNSELELLGAAYDGRAYRHLAETSETFSRDNAKQKIYCFIGFNALTPSEMKIMNSLYRLGSAQFFWDFHNSYVADNKSHDAGYFIRKNIKKFPAPESFKRSVSSEKPGPKIQVIAAPNDPAQVKTMSNILLSLNDDKKLTEDNLAVVLSDEGLIPQVMQSIPDTYQDINITMGYPMLTTPTYDLVLSIIRLHKNRKDSQTDVQFYYKDVLRILDHQYIFNDKESGIKELRKEIVGANNIYPSMGQLGLSSVTGLIFSKISTPADLVRTMRDIISSISERLNAQQSTSELSDNKLQNEYLYHMYLVMNHLDRILELSGTEIGYDTFTKIFRKVVRSRSVPFIGEPLKGLQVMGILETRAIDFQNLIILSMNEGIFPKSTSNPSMIPFSIRKGFGLPTPEYQDRIYAYYFYRLLHEAQNIWFIYNSNSDGLFSGEISRFLYQLKYLENLNINEKAISTSIKQYNLRTISVYKGQAEMDILEQFGHTGDKYLSPSALNSYLDCSLQFYFKYIANIKEPETITEAIDPLIFGNILHSAMEELYKQMTGKSIDAPFITKLIRDKKNLRQCIDQAIQRQWLKGHGSISGKHLIFKEVLLKYILNILHIDLQITPFKIIGLEKKIDKILQIPELQGGSGIRLGGKIDRIDQTEKYTRIIDYKSGGANKRISHLFSVFERGKNGRNRAAFQTLIYGWLYQSQNENERLLPGLYDIRSMHDDSFDPALSIAKKPILDCTNLLPEIEHLLKDLLIELFDPEKSFEQVKDTRICEHCLYNSICRRS